MNHSFDVDIACLHGVDAAILIENFRFWIAKNKANNRHFYDGRWWTYNSVKAFSELFPYWSGPQVRRIIEKLQDAGVLVSGSYNQNPWDKTKWYAFGDGFDLMKKSVPFAEIGKSDTDINGGCGRKAEGAMNGEVVQVPDLWAADAQTSRDIGSGRNRAGVRREGCASPTTQAGQENSADNRETASAGCL